MAIASLLMAITRLLSGYSHLLNSLNMPHGHFFDGLTVGTLFVDGLFIVVITFLLNGILVHGYSI